MGSTIAAGLIDQVVSNAALQAFTDYLAPLRVFSIDYNDSNEKTVEIPFYSADAATDFTAGTTAYSDNSGGTVAGVEVSIDAHKFATVSLTDTQRANSPKVILEEFGYQAGAAVAAAMTADIMAEITNANFSSKLAKGSALFQYNSLVDIKKLCSKLKIPVGRSLVLDEDYYNELLKDEGIKSRAVLNLDAGNTGELQNIAGFREIHECTNIPSNSENLVGFACAPQALAIAMRYLGPQDGADYIMAMPFVDPTSGAVLGMRKFYDKDKALMHLVYEANYGYETGNGSALVRIVSA